MTPNGKPVGSHVVETNVRCLIEAGSEPWATGRKTKRGEYLGRLPKPARPLAELLYQELDALKCEAKKAMLTEAQTHPEFRLVKSCPGLGPIRAAELLPIMVTP